MLLQTQPLGHYLAAVRPALYPPPLPSPLQTLLVLLKKQPPEGRKLFVVGTTSLGLVMQVRSPGAGTSEAVTCMGEEVLAPGVPQVSLPGVVVSRAGC